MPGRFILDTNIVIALFAKHAGVVSNTERAREIMIPSIVLGELYYGARKSHRSAENLARLDSFHSRPAFFSLTAIQRGNTAR